MDYILNNNEKKEVLETFKKLDISPTIEKEKIKQAFKKKALIYHPDKVTDTETKTKYQEKFKDLVNIRDFCLEVSEIDNLLEQLASYNVSDNNSYENKEKFTDEERTASAQTENVSNNTSSKNKETFTADRNKSNTQANDEWEQFVQDKNAYFNAVDASIISINSMISLTIFSIVFSVGISVMIALLITALVAIFSSSFAIPILGWIGGIAFFIWLVNNLGEYYQKIEAYTLESLVTTGYPYSVFIFGWIAQNIIIGTISSYFIAFWTILLLVFTNLGYLILYANMKDKLEKIQESLDKIRNTLKTDIIILRAKSRFSNK